MIKVIHTARKNGSHLFDKIRTALKVYIMPIQLNVYIWWIHDTLERVLIISLEYTLSRWKTTCFLLDTIITRTNQEVKELVLISHSKNTPSNQTIYFTAPAEHNRVLSHLVLFHSSLSFTHKILTIKSISYLPKQYPIIYPEHFFLSLRPRFIYMYRP